MLITNFVLELILFNHRAAIACCDCVVYDFVFFFQLLSILCSEKNTHLICETLMFKNDLISTLINTLQFVHYELTNRIIGVFRQLK